MRFPAAPLPVVASIPDMSCLFGIVVKFYFRLRNLDGTLTHSLRIGWCFVWKRTQRSAACHVCLLSQTFAMHFYFMNKKC